MAPANSNVSANSAAGSSSSTQGSYRTLWMKNYLISPLNIKENLDKKTKFNSFFEH